MGLLIVVGIVVGVVVGMNNSEQKDVSSLNTTGSVPPDPENSVASFGEKATDCLEGNKDYDAWERFMRIQSFVLEQVAGMTDAIKLPGTPARAVICWIADG